MKRKKKIQSKREMLSQAKAWELEASRLFKLADEMLKIGAENQAYNYRDHANSHRVQSRRLNKMAFRLYPSEILADVKLSIHDGGVDYSKRDSRWYKQEKEERKRKKEKKFN